MCKLGLSRIHSRVDFGVYLTAALAQSNLLYIYLGSRLLLDTYQVPKKAARRVGRSKPTMRHHQPISDLYELNNNSICP